MVTDEEFQELKAQVEQITRYFDQAPIEDDAVQQSWPRLDRGLSDSQDMTRFQHLRGIFDQGGGPFRLRDPDNVSNTMVLKVSSLTGTAEATLRGGFYRLRQDIPLAFPAVAAPTDQYVVIEYDPIRAADGGPPFEAKVVESIDYSQGKDYIITHRVRRRPSQLLTDAPVDEYRPRVSSASYYWSVDNLPTPSAVHWGATALIGETGEWWVARGPAGSGEVTRWENLSNPQPTAVTPHAWNVHYPGDPIQGQIIGGRVHLSGKLERSSGDNYTLRGQGWPVCTLPDSLLPRRWGRHPVALSYGSQGEPRLGMVDINLAGVVTAYVPGPVKFLSLDGVSFPARGGRHVIEGT